MKLLKYLLVLVTGIFSLSVSAQSTKTDTIKVYGNCGMCKTRIEKALKLEGVSSASWDSDTKLLIVTYNPDITSNDALQQKISSVGHDTEKYTASDVVYKKLPGCCKYERKQKQE
jgi:copper chaperone CopZ